MKSWRIQDLHPFEWFTGVAFGGPTYYGLISDAGGFIRGKSPIGSRVGVGPAGLPGSAWAWDEDDAYTDWYSGHEIGHSIGRKHPSKGNRCDHSADDDSYPYIDSFIGPVGGTLHGFDPGDFNLGAKRMFLHGNIWHDMMGYCDYQWLSDYTYEGLYNELRETNVAAASAAAPRQGELLIVTGGVNPETGTAAFTVVKWVDQVAVTPPLIPICSNKLVRGRD